jgi:hypothetical protein
MFVASLPVAAFVVVAFFTQRPWFRYSIYTAAAWAGVAALVMLVRVMQAGSSATVVGNFFRAGGSFGLYLALVAAFGAAGAFGYLALRQLAR